MTEAKSKRALAALATITVVAAVLVIASQQREHDTSEADRRWYGEQWEVARHCFVGTPIRSGASEAVVAERIEARAFDALARIEGDADPEARWPLGCSRALAPLRHAPEGVADPAEELADLELAAAALLAAPVSASALADRARVMAASVRRLDGRMPAGAGYDPARYAEDDARQRWGAVVETLSCPPPRVARRPFFSATIGGETLHDERVLSGVSERLVGDGDDVRLARSGPGVDEERRLAPGLRLPRFADDAHIAWLTAQDPPAVVLESIGDGARAEPVPLAVGTPDAWAVRDGAWLVRTPAGVWRVRSAGAHDATPIGREPPDQGVVTASDGARLALAWFEEDRWIGVWCDETCRALEPFRAGGDLQLAVVASRVIALARGVHSDLAFARTPTEDGWLDPMVAPRGVLRVEDELFVVETCDGERRSTDGVSWTAGD